MPIYRPSELRDLLESLGVSPKKGFSQNFLIDGNVIRKIADTANICENDLVLEIGAGPGALTEELLKRGAEVIAVEKDPVWASALKKWEHPRLTVYEDDILKFPLEEVFKGKKSIKVAANLPYHITTPIITKLAPLYPLFSDLIVMVQDEVAVRLASPHGSRDFGSISVFLQYWSDVSYAFKVKKVSFYPAPKVDSAVVHLKLKAGVLEDSEPFFAMTREAFKHRRKMLRGALSDLYEPAAVEKALVELDLNPLSRPENLGVQEFLKLFGKLSSCAEKE
jgi:16S rRNA (adenine1518-N6/adenine1519-N6)-dimethyltransferase